MAVILGVGTDFADINRIKRSLDQFGERFLNRIYTKQEIEASFRRKNPAARLAQRWAAKEACSKALGTGLRQGVFWRDMEVIHLPSGQPTIRLHGGALKRAEALTPKNYVPKIDVSLTDEYPLAHGIVILSAVEAKLAKELNLYG
ncbi:MAG: holo-ACP synthase [Alphaproteobacteria bacterium]